MRSRNWPRPTSRSPSSTAARCPRRKNWAWTAAAYLNGLCEAASELRRRTLDIIRHGRTAEGERLLAAMDDVYGVLVTMDFPDAITGGLRRSTDALRAVLERTRGDLTNSLQQEKLLRELQAFEQRINGK